MIPRVGFYAIPVDDFGGAVGFEVVEIEVKQIVGQETGSGGRHFHLGPDQVVFPEGAAGEEEIVAAKRAALACALRYYIDEEKRLADEVLRAGARIESCREAIRSRSVAEKDDKGGASE
jgi:hypothetical protein